MAAYSSTELLDKLSRVNIPEVVKKIFRDVVDSLSGAIDTTSSTSELNILTGVTSTAAELNILDGVTSTAAELNILDGVTASAYEINKSSDRSARTQTLTTSGSVSEWTECLLLDNDTTAIAATIASAFNRGLLVVKAISEPGIGEDHTVTMQSGTWNGTDTLATFQDINDALIVYFDGDGNGTVIVNNGSVVLGS